MGEVTADYSGCDCEGRHTEQDADGFQPLHDPVRCGHRGCRDRHTVVVLMPDRQHGQHSAERRDGDDRGERPEEEPWATELDPFGAEHRGHDAHPGMSGAGMPEMRNPTEAATEASVEAATAASSEASGELRLRGIRSPSIPPVATRKVSSSVGR